MLTKNKLKTLKEAAESETISLIFQVKTVNNTRGSMLLGFK